MSGRSLFAELKRRHVYKVGAAYAVAGWLLVQVVTQIFPVFDIPISWVRLVVIFVAIGFPIAVALSWIFDLTPEGLVRTDDAATSNAPSLQSTQHRIERKLNYLLASLLLLALAYLVAERFVPAMMHSQGAGGDVSNAAASTPSIAVLAFADMSEAGDQAYFADGISEELLNLLAQVPQLHVAGRTSSFSFKGKTMSIKDIGKALEVTSVLEGGVRKAGDRLRVTAQLVNVADGFQLWSQTYDRKLTDIFAVQDDIAGAVVDALKFKLLPVDRPSSAKEHVPSFETYDHFLLGRQLLIRNDPQFYPQAVDAFRRAIALDPEYAEGYAGLAMAESFVAEDISDQTMRAEAQRSAMVAADKAVELGPALGDAYAARGYLRGTNEWDWEGALADLQKAVSLDPRDARNQLRYGYLLATLGRLPEAANALANGTLQDPLFSPAWYWLGRIKMAQGDYAGATLALNRTLAINPEYASAAWSLGTVALVRGDAGKALEIFMHLKRPLGIAMAEHDLGHLDESKQALMPFIDAHAGDSAYAIAGAYAWCNDRDQAFTWLTRAIAQHDDGMQYVKYDPLLRSLRDDARYMDLLRAVKLSE
jgi:TolB-like protein